MCFSAEASFAVGGALIPAGGYCVYAAVRKQPKYLPLAVVPVLFSVQQASEGVVWLALDQTNAELAQSAGLVFLFFALAFWPFWIVLQAAVSEANRTRRWMLIVLTLMSTVWFWILYFPLLIDPEELLRIQVVHHSIRYLYPHLPVYEYLPQTLLRVLYFATVAVPFVIASRSISWLPGALLALSAVVSVLIFEYAFVSVWCFFAALLSAFLCFMFHSLPATYSKAQT